LTASPNGGLKPSFEAFVEPSADGFIPKFTVSEPGPYQVKVEVCDTPIKDFRIDAYEPINPGKVKAFGPGLSHGSVDKPADFMIDTRGAGNGALNLTVEGPCEARIDCKDNQDGTCQVSYLPTMAGNYMINILYQGVHIPGSPFQATIESDLDIRGIKCYGPGIDPKGTFLKFMCTFRVW
jgi:filamin